MKYLALAILFFQSSVLLSQEQKLPVGEIIESVEVKNSNNETYSLYLPSNFSQNKLAAVIFIFDPVARGRVGVEVFKDAAEKFNYILVCSNNSKNGPYDVNFGIANRLFEDVFSRFNIDNNRIYTAGFSGGSRLAASIAILTNQIEGVIACGAGFAQQPNLENKFSYVGLVGNEDMNYQEMNSNLTMLNELKLANVLFTYNDGHRWPPKEQIERALGWLEIQALNKGLKKKNNDFLMHQFKKELETANSMSVNKPYEATIEYERTINNFKSFFDVDSLIEKVGRLKKKEGYVRVSKQIKNIEKSEYQLMEMFLNRFRAESQLGKTDDNFEWWETELEKLSKHIPDEENIYEVKMFKRIKYRLFAMAIENSNIYGSRNNWNQANYCDKLLTLMLPENPIWHYRLATSYAQLDNMSQTISHLKKAINFDFKNPEQIVVQKEFEKFKKKKRFIKFLESINN